jgi:CP family cyanate transporter-like MFS transporter
MRALWPTALSLFFFTLLLSLGITLSQTAVPVLIRHWFAKQIGLVAALFTDGLIIGEAVAAGLTVPVMLRFMGDDAWASTFIFWGVPVVVLLAFWLWLAPPAHTRVSKRLLSPQRNTVTASQSSAPPIQRTRVSALHLGILVGGGSLVYFGMNAWIASYNQAMHQSYLTPLSLLILNAAQLPASLGVTLIASDSRAVAGPLLLPVLSAPSRLLDGYSPLPRCNIFGQRCSARVQRLSSRLVLHCRHCWQALRK